MKGVIVGYGSIGPLHCNKLRQLEIQVGVVDINPQRRAQALADGAVPFSSVAEAAACQPDFWNVCVGTPDHLSVIESIVDLMPDTCIIVEKPICLHAQLDELQRVLSRFHGKVCINENYYASRITQLVRRIACYQLQLEVHRVVVEMTKNREHDFARGRFLDLEGGAIKYEGTHMLAVLEDLDQRFLPSEIEEAHSTHAMIPGQDGPHLLAHQGSADYRCRTAERIEVLLHSSMTGQVRHPYPPYGVDAIPLGSQVRHRVLAVHGRDADDQDVTVVGFYEPLDQLPRGHGAVAFIRNGTLHRVVAPIADDHMLAQLARGLAYFRGQSPNPCSVEAAVRTTRLLHALGQAATASTQTTAAWNQQPLTGRSTVKSC